MGSLDHPFSPPALALGAEATFVARTMDRDPQHMRDVLKAANDHRGTSLVEIYQNCNVFNDGAFEVFTDKATKADTTIMLQQGQPLVFGAAQDKGIRLQGTKPEVVSLNEHSKDDLWVHDQHDLIKATLLSRMFNNNALEGGLPRPFGVFYKEGRTCYEEAMKAQIEEAIAAKGEGDLDRLIRGSHTWTV